ncbi:uncharacterized protein LOC126264399 [Aethina tumida]|uniref:uncharacterized protein LOC126264399 n=1 Tax=Aethina tumida TaxID=116153 RepID=UPI002148B39D|nr:uncharacterized protein LOC126264399 [Aethina tumida]
MIPKVQENTPNPSSDEDGGNVSLDGNVSHEDVVSIQGDVGDSMPNSGRSDISRSDVNSDEGRDLTPDSGLRVVDYIADVLERRPDSAPDGRVGVHFNTNAGRSGPDFDGDGEGYVDNETGENDSSNGRRGGYHGGEAADPLPGSAPGPVDQRNLDDEIEQLNASMAAISFDADSLEENGAEDDESEKTGQSCDSILELEDTLDSPDTMLRRAAKGAGLVVDNPDFDEEETSEPNSSVDQVHADFYNNFEDIYDDDDAFV